MKCPKCEKPNKPNIKNCASCGAVMPIRKKKATVSKETKTKTVKKVSPKVSPKVEEIKTEPIFELSEEKKQIKKAIKKIKKINKIVYLYILLAITSLLLIIFISLSRNTIICTTETVKGDNTYRPIMKIRYHDNKMLSFKYIAEYRSKKNNEEEYNSIYDTLMEGLKNKTNFSKIVKANYGKKYLNVSYNFNEDNIKYISSYIGVAVEAYSDNVSAFVAESEAGGFECK